MPRNTQHGIRKKEDRRSRITHHASRLSIVALFTYLLSSAYLSTQPSQPIEGTNFKIVGEFYDPPNERQMKDLIEGSRWRHQGTQTVVNDVKVQTFRTNGVVELIIDAPECFYDETRKAINSPGPVHFRTADGRFSLQGVGFLWLQTNSTLYISNQVQTIVLTELLQSTAESVRTNSSTNNTKGVTIYSDRFEYAKDSGVGIYRGNVHAVGTNANFRARGEVMEVLVPERERQLQTITMSEKVVLDYATDNENLEASGEKAIYTAATGLATISGNPAWHDDKQRQGRGDELVIDQTNRIFQAISNAWVKMPRQSSGAPGLLSSATNSAAGTNQFVEIFSDHYEFRTNSAEFGDHVLVLDSANGQTNGTLASATLLVTLVGTNELQTMVAEKNVVFQREDKQFTGEKAVYTATNNMLELTGKPAWRDGPREGNGELLLANLQRGEMRVFTNAFMRVPAKELGPTMAMAPRASAAAPLPAGSTKPGESPPVVSTKEKVEGNFSPLREIAERKPQTKSPAISEPRPAAPEFADIFSESYTVTTNTAYFEGGVRIIHPRLNWVCETMNVESSNPNSNVTMVAEQRVEFDLQSGTNTDKGQDIHGTCDRAVYNYAITPSGTNDTMTLTGNPILETTNSVITNNIIVVDCANNKLMAPGRYRIYGTANASPIPTNSFRLPSSHKKK
jgi:lipopolysaccharide export system protein LptA